LAVHFFAVLYKTTQNGHILRTYSRELKLLRPIFRCPFSNFDAGLHVLFRISLKAINKLNESKIIVNFAGWVKCHWRCCRCGFNRQFKFLILRLKWRTFVCTFNHLFVSRLRCVQRWFPLHSIAAHFLESKFLKKLWGWVGGKYLVLSTGLIKWIGHRKEIRKLTFRR